MKTKQGGMMARRFTQNSKTLLNDRKHKNRVVLSTLGTIVSMLTILGLVITHVRAGTSDFTFGTVGDTGTSTNAQSVFKAIGSTAASDSMFKFVQHVGDYSYAELATPGPSGTTAGTNAWCQLVKDKVNEGASLPSGNTLGENFPFMLATGNHEATLSQPNPSLYGVVGKTTPYHNDQIEDLKNCLPNQFASHTTTSPFVEGGASNSNYAREYYYDYPSTNPIARFIVTAPGTAYNMTQTDGNGLYDYSAGSDHYNWLSGAIDSARSGGIKWVVVTNHTNYIAASSGHDTDISSDYFNLLLTKKVDLILQGHNHIYQRSKQLVNGVSGCTTLVDNTYNANCVASDGGATNTFTKGEGAIMAIVGMGGDGLHSINSSDGDYSYFDANMGLGSQDTFGFLKVAVTDTQMTASFVHGTGQPTGFTDTFTIEGPADTTAPATSLTAPAASTTLSGTTTLTATASDNVGVTKVEFWEGATKLGEDITSPYSYDWNTTTATNGAVSLTAKAFDAAGNSTVSASVSATVSNTSSDTTAPATSLTAPVASATLSGTTTLTATASDNVGVTKVEFWEGATKLGEDITSPYSYDWNTTTATNGAVSLTAKAFDAAGNSTVSASVSATVSNTSSDTTAPATSLTAPVASATLSGTTTLTATASDNVGVTKVEFWEGATKLGEDITSPYSYDWNTTTATNGAVSLTAKAFDAAGNSTVSASVSATVSNTSSDTTAPATSLTAPAASTTLSGTTTLTATASDNVGVTKVEFWEGATKLGEDITSPYSYDWNTTTATNGAVSLTAKAFDAAGNSTVSASVSATVSNTSSDTTAPATSLTAPAASTTLSGTTTLTATASDNVGVTKVEFWEGATKLGEDITSPYSYDWNTTTATNGAVSLTAKAFDAAGNSTVSASVSATVFNTANAVPTVNLGTTASAEPTPISKASMSVTAGTCNDFRTAKTVTASGLTAPDGNVTVLGGFDFILGCSAAGGMATVDITLGARYEDTSKLRVYKTNGTTVTDVTAQMTIQNTATSTVLRYTLTDGTGFDSDATVNGAIDDPLYVGVLGATTTAEELADTGTRLTSVLVGAAVLLTGSVYIFKQISRRYQLHR
jgi:hypothetical protein